MQPFMAMIVPMGSSGPVDPGYSPPWARPGAPVYPDHSLPGGQGGVPTHPIYYPPGIWGPTDPRPSPPIYIPPPGSPPPLGIWGPTDPRPTNPIARPGDPNYPGGPPGIWGPTDPRPTHPIVLPPNLPPEIPGGPGEPQRKVEWKTGWTAETGWVIVGVPAEGTLVPTPSKK